MRKSTLKLAQDAFFAFCQGWMTGDFQPFLAMLADKLDFSYPYGKHRGRFTGQDGKAQITAKCHDHTAAGDYLNFQPPHHITSSETTVMFEFECAGVIDGEAYHGRIAIALDVSGDRVSGFREYFGDVDW
jgi:ketosteroid isomerase-like protein